MDDYILVYSISLIGLCFLLFNTIYSFVLKNKIKKTTFSLFSVYLLSLFIIETFCHVLGISKPGSNYFISHFYFNCQFIIISIFFIILFKNEKKPRLFIYIISSIVLFIIAMTYMFNYFSFWEFNLVEICLTSFVIFAYILYYFKLTISKENVEFTSFFTGLAIYLISSSLIFITGNVELVLLEKPFIDIWILNSLVYLLFQYFIFKELKYFKIRNLK